MDDIYYNMMNSNYKPIPKVYTNFGYGLAVEQKIHSTSENASSGFISGEINHQTNSDVAIVYESGKKTSRQVWADLIASDQSDDESTETVEYESSDVYMNQSSFAYSFENESTNTIDSDLNVEEFGPVRVSTPIKTSQLNDLVDKFDINFNLNDKFCTFCFDHGAHEMIYQSHTLKDNKNRVLCPALRILECEICKVDGDDAHEIQDCPTLVEN